MVAGKGRMTTGFHKSPSTQKKDMTSPLPLPLPPSPLKPPSSGSSTKPANNSGKSGFTRSFGVYFPRASAQVHAAASSQNAVISELRRQVEELREREARLKTENLELKLLGESVSVIPLLESQITEKNVEIENSRKDTARLAEENETLKRELDRSEELRRETDRREKEMEAENVELRKIVSSSLRESDDHALLVSQRFQGLMDVSAKSNLIRSLKRVGSMKNMPDPGPNPENNKTIASSGNADGDISRKEETEGYSSGSISEVLTESSSISIRSKAPRVPKPPPKRSSSFNGFVDSTKNRADPKPQKTIPPPPPLPPLLHRPPSPPSVSEAPPPLPPPPPPKSLNIASAKVRRVPEVVEFYHSLMRRDSTNSRRDSTGGGNAAAEAVLASSNARDMIGEIENRSVYLLAVKIKFELLNELSTFGLVSLSCVSEN